MMKLYQFPYMYPPPYYVVPMRHPVYWTIPYEGQYQYPFNLPRQEDIKLTDHGKEPYVININEASKQNNTFRTAIWTGEHLQVVLMSIGVGEDIGLEAHPTVDQFLRIEDGEGFVQMGSTKENLDFETMVYDDDAIMVPAGTWHNVTNTGHTPLKLYTIYAPPNHPFGTVQQTKAEAD